MLVYNNYKILCVNYFIVSYSVIVEVQSFLDKHFSLNERNLKNICTYNELLFIIKIYFFDLYLYLFWYVQLKCGHVFHLHCCKNVLANKWNGPRITFSFSQCPICKVTIKPTFYSKQSIFNSC